MAPGYRSRTANLIAGLTVGVTVGVTVAVVVAGCSLQKPADGPVFASAPADGVLAGGCLVGSWHQTGGTQRLDVLESPLEIRLVSGGGDLTLAADGTGTLAHPGAAVWTGSNGAHKVEVAFIGTATLSYTAVAGGWTQIADNTKIVTNLTLDGTQDAPHAGSAGRTASGTYRCGPVELIITTDGTQDAYVRNP
jgi:hypothetical protein